MKNLARRMIAILLTVIMLITTSVSVFAQSYAVDTMSQEQLKEALRGSPEQIAIYPNGQFNFLTPQMTTSEDLESVEITVIREGGTTGKATVTLKAIDVTAEYGKDYVLKVRGILGNTTIKKNTSAVPLIQSMIGMEDIGVVDAVYTQTEDTVEDLSLEQTNIQEEVPLRTLQSSRKSSGLKVAREVYTGIESDRKDWKNANESEKQQIKQSYEEFYQGVPGVETELVFQEGEYIKKVYFVTIDDKLSESDEQVLLTLTHPTGGSQLGDSATGYMNIKDNDPYEQLQFKMQVPQVTVQREEGVAKVTIQRTSGLHQYGQIHVATAEITASPDDDYKPMAQPVVFVPGAKEQTVEIPILNIRGIQDDLTFQVVLDPESPNIIINEAATIVTLKNPPVYRMLPNDIQAPSINSASDLSASASAATNSAKKHVIKANEINIKNGRDRKPYFSDPYMYLNPNKNGHWQNVVMDFDLYGIEKIDFKWGNTSPGRHWKEKTGWWPFRKTKDRYSKNFYSILALNNKGNFDNQIIRKDASFSIYDDSYTLKATDWEYSKIIFQTTVHSTDDPSQLFVGDVKLHYKPYTIYIQNEIRDVDANITPIEYTGINTKKEGKKRYIGGIKISDMEALHKNIYRDDIVRFTPDFINSEDAERVYLYGYKIQQNNAGAYKFFEGTTLNFNKEWMKANQNLIFNEKDIYMRPVYRQKPAFVKINVDEELGGVTGFTTGNVLKIGMEDTIKFNAYAKAGYFASGYTAKKANNPTTQNKLSQWDVTEGAEYISGNINTPAKNLGSNRVSKRGYTPTPFTELPLTINPNIPGELEFKPIHAFTDLTVTFSVPYLTVKSYPQKNGNEAKGTIQLASPIPIEDIPASLHKPEKEKTQKEKDNEEAFRNKYQGSASKPLEIKPIQKGEIYSIAAATEDGFVTQWIDWTGDFNGDGIISKEEQDLLGNYVVSRNTITGNYFHYKTNFDRPLIYYSFAPRGTTTEEGIIAGTIKIAGGSVLKKATGTLEKSSAIPVEDAKVTIDSTVLYTDAEGRFEHSSIDYKIHEKRAISIEYKGYKYIGYANVNADGEYIINVYDEFEPYDFKVYRTMDGKEEAVYPTQNNLDCNVTNGDKLHKFTFAVASKVPGLEPKEAKIRVYSRNGETSKEYNTTLTGSRIFTLEANPAAEGWMPGSYMTIQVFDQNGKAYIEHDVGFRFIRAMEAFAFGSSFKTPAKPVLDLVGKVDVLMDLGVRGKTEDYFKPSGDTIILNFGFKQDYQKADIDLKSTAKKENTTKEEAADKIDKATKDGKVNKSKLTANTNFGFEVSLNLVMQLDNDEDSDKRGEYYFKEMVLCGKIHASVFTKYEYMTPIGIPVFMTFTLIGDATALLVIEEYDNKKMYFDGNGEIDFLKAGGYSKADRDFTIYGIFLLRPSIKISVGAGFNVLNVSVSGTAAFALDFTTLNSGKGAVTLSADISLKILFITKRWEIVSKQFKLFEYGEGIPRTSSSLFQGTDYLYDRIDDFEQLSRDYLQNRSGWNQGNPTTQSIRSSATGFSIAQSIQEQTLQTGIYPYPDSKMVHLGNGQLLLVFVDDDGSRAEQNRTTIKYSIYNGTVWSQPQIIDKDGTLDGYPDVFDLGDKVVIAWSSASKAFESTATPIEMLTAMDIKVTFFDKSTKTLGDIQQVTKETAQDLSSDTQPTLAFDETTGKLILYYTKTEYETSLIPSNPNEQTVALVGDIVNAYSVIAYMFYENGVWRNKYTEAEKQVIIANTNITVADFVYYEKDWYGQGFLNLAPAVIIAETDISNLILTPSTSNMDPKIIESTAISYNGLALYVYVMDADQDIKTSYDQELYLQIYNFEEQTFTHPIQLTNNGVKDGSPQMIRSNGITYLYWLSDGDIVYMDISKLVQTGLVKKQVGNKEIYIIDKSQNSNYRGSSIAVKQKENLPLDQFKVTTDHNSDTYLLWTENLLTFKEGIAGNSAEATDPNNQYKEKQLFAARRQEVLVDVTYPVFNEDGTPMLYPEKDDEGNTVDYTTQPDSADGTTVKVGDPILIKEKAVKSIWSYPVQLTHEQGANISDISYIVLPNGLLQAVYVKYKQVVEKISEGSKTASIHVDDTSNRSLISTSFTPYSNITMDTKDIIFDRENIQPRNEVTVTTTIQNKGLQIAKDVKILFYQVQNSIETGIEEYLIADASGNNQMLGGEEIQRSTTWTVPESITDLSIKIVIKDKNNNTIATGTKAVEAVPILKVNELQAYMSAQNEVAIQASVTNEGNQEAINQVVDLYANDQKLSSYTIEKLSVGETASIEMKAAVDATHFVPKQTTDGSLAETLPIRVSTGSNTATEYIERSIDANSLASIHMITDITIQGIPNKLTKGKTAILTAKLNAPAPLQNVKVVWTSSDPSVASVDSNGGIYAGALGKATITAQVIPTNTEYILERDAMPKQLDILPYIPQSAIKHKAITIEVSMPDTNTQQTPSKDSSGSSTSIQTGAQNQTVYQNTLTVTGANVKVDGDALSKALQNASDENPLLIKFADSQNKIVIQLPTKIIQESTIKKIMIEVSGIKITLPKAYFTNTESGISIEKVLKDNMPGFKIHRVEDSKEATFTTPVRVDIPFAPPAFIANTDYLVLTNVKDNRSTPVVNSYYDEDEKTVVALIRDASEYILAYKPVIFEDAKDTWSHKAVTYLAAREVINGVGNGAFAPEVNVTRADFVTMLVRMLDLKVPTAANFADVDQNKYYADALATAKSLGIINGMGGNTFNPEAQISRQDMFVIAARALQKFDLVDGAASGNADFKDQANIANYAQDSIHILQANKLVQGSNGAVNPRSSAKRSETAQFLYNVFISTNKKYQEHSLSGLDTSK